MRLSLFSEKVSRRRSPDGDRAAVSFVRRCDFSDRSDADLADTTSRLRELPTLSDGALYEACAEAGVPRLKIGFWRFARGDDYWSAVSRARDALSRFHLLSETFGVQTCYQVHSGSILGSNCAGVMHLIRGFDPKFIGAYPDIGHMALDGEDWDMGFAMLGNHLSVIGAKDAYHAPQPKRSTPPYLPKFVKLGDGSVDWARCMQAIVALGFDGPISVHTEYDFDETVIRKVGYAESAPPNLYKWAKEDVRFLKNMTNP